MLSPLLSSADSNSVRVAEAGVRSIIFCRRSSASVTAPFRASGLSTDITHVR